MNRKAGIFVALIILAGLMIAGNAMAGLVPNGDFETGDLTDWGVTGSGWAADWNVISGNYSAIIETGVSAYGELCTWMYSSNVYPQYYPTSVNVSFKVRYKTDESVYPYSGCNDPLTVELMTGKGSVELVKIAGSGITPGPFSKVTNLATGTAIVPPMVTPMSPGMDYNLESPTFEVKATLNYTLCDPLYLQFYICDACDASVDSAAFIDDVDITPVYSTTTGWYSFIGRRTLCPPSNGVASIPGR